ncbi:H-2 class I histocompatibility antigen, Q10 alpha chain-like [Megalobrama amblycephala]|uniref:H-2 class I histocompatibility antigen, Q10 alpha chain-like n=1 Tax=Megalobrama amblycephala TaxID=75352 RepID=UPI002014720B|nr:H-2 class I histocompatibility antigen, Q10 alpha chain-like [Megalobrama amblycephala]XP_048014378.1 H-2 class I histocompatibility antigen, Q10 alpha chain-like [Megalobrama amblycephala]
MCTRVTMKIFVPLCVLYWILPSIQAERHSLYYIYTALSKPVDLPGIYKFSAMGLLDGTQIDYYNSEEKKKIPKKSWMKEKMQEDYWEKGTQSRKSKEWWFNINVHILMYRMRHYDSDPHVLQWITGCEVEQQGDEVKFSGGFYQFSYDGEDFLFFDVKSSRWIAAFSIAVLTKIKWDNIPTLNQYIKRYLEKECVDWLNKYREYGDEKLRNGSPPDVHVFAERSTWDKTMLKLTCMATGFYPKDVMMTIRKNHEPLPGDEIDYTEIRPNQDETFQLSKSVEIKEEEKDEYDCFVTHKSIKEPIIAKCDGKCPPNAVAGIIGAVIGGVLIALSCLFLTIYILKKRTINGRESRDTAGASDTSETHCYWDNVNQEYEDSRNRLSAVSTEALIQPDDL